MGAGVPRRYRRAPCCSRLVCCWGASLPRPARDPHHPWDGSTAHKIMPRIASLHAPPRVLQDAWGGPVLPGGSQWGAQPPPGDPGAASPAVPTSGSWGAQPSPSGVCGFPSAPAPSPAIFGRIPGRPHACSPPPHRCRWGRLFWARGDVRGGRARAAALPSAPAPLLCGWESRDLPLRVALGFGVFFTCFVLQ